MKSFSSTTRSSALQQGHTLVELLVAISLGSVVLAFLGGVLLVSEMRVSARIQKNLDAKDAANRAIDLIRREANFSSRIDSGDASFSSTLKCGISTLTFYQNNQTKPVCYKTVAPGQLPYEYIGAGFQGPCVLVRIGYPYRPTGDIDDSGDKLLISVLLDGVANIGSNCSSLNHRGFTLQLASSPFPSNTPFAPPNRIGNAQIIMDSRASYSFSLRVPSHLAYDGTDLLRKCLNQTGKCESNATQVHWLPENKNTVDETPFGDKEKENLFYFRYPYAQYQVTGRSSTDTCTYNWCTVTGGVAGGEKLFALENVDALIFPDKEIRPTR
jgi:prepilin-type N-terminal cleavage/methylation domain-containing protein